jgi:hypothetical protein
MDLSILPHSKKGFARFAYLFKPLSVAIEGRKVGTTGPGYKNVNSSFNDSCSSVGGSAFNVSK